jgi:hypothetical protein
MEHKIHRSKIFILLGTIAMIGSFSFDGARAMEDEQLEKSIRLHAPTRVEQELYDLERPKLDFEKATYDGMTWDRRNICAMPKLECIVELWELADKGAKLLQQNGVPKQLIEKINKRRAQEKITEKKARENIIRKEAIKEDLKELKRRVASIPEEERIAAGLYLMRQNAERGDARAQASLGLNYRVGASGLEKDFTQAIYWFSQAAEQGNAHGQVGLGNIYNIGGFGVEKNDSLADYWYQKAAAQGNVTAKKFLREKKRELKGVESVTDSTGQDMGIKIGGFYKIVNREKGWILNVNTAHMKESSQEVTSQVNNGNYDSHRLFKIIPEENGYYLIKNKESKKVISVQNAGSKEKQLSVKAQRKERQSIDHQLFRFIPQGSGYYLIENKQSGKLLNVWNAFNGFASWLDTTAEPNDNWWLNHRSFKFEPEGHTPIQFLPTLAE